MKQEYALLYNDMLQDIERCLQLPHPEKENAESCFWIARKYCDKLHSCIKERGFSNEQDEIDFFRNVKPGFTMYIEYFVILSEALQFEPNIRQLPDEISNSVSKNEWSKAVANSIREYWQNEEKRFKRFCERHITFIGYYESGKQCNDHHYFLRHNSLPQKASNVPLYDADADYCTHHEQLLRSYLANKKYWEYVRGRLNREYLASSQEKEKSNDRSD